MILNRLIPCFALGAVLAVADTRITEIKSSALKVQKDAESVSAMLKTKRADFDKVRETLDNSSSDIDKLKSLAAEFEASNPSLTVTQRQDWELLKQKVQLLGIFHARKKELLSEQPEKNRNMLRAHADGVAKRAAMLQQTAARLER